MRSCAKFPLVMFTLTLCPLAVLLCFGEAISAPVINKFNPPVASRDLTSEIEITGTNFGEDRGKVIFSPTDEPQVVEEVEIVSWSPTRILVRAPDLRFGHYLVIVEDSKEESSRKDYFVDPQREVDRVIQLKAAGISTKAILNILDENEVFQKFKDRRDRLSGNEIADLKKAGFEDDFIEKWHLAPSYVTVGPAGIYLSKANIVAGAAVVRIYMPPRSFFQKTARLALFPRVDKIKHIRDLICRDEHEGCWFLNPSAFWNRLDINVGATTAAETAGRSTSHFLVGGSVELNRYALVNIGLAFTTEGKFSQSAQFYMGFTIDSNILKEFGIIAK